MCSNYILKYESGYEQGIYAAIYAQYMRLLVYDCDLSKTLLTKYLRHIQRNIDKAYKNRDQVRGIQIGNFAVKTQEDAVVESYGGSGMPALMLMFPASDTATLLESVGDEECRNSSDVYTTDGKLIMKNATSEQVHQLDSGLYIFQGKKYLVNRN